MCIVVNIENAGNVFEFQLENQHTIVFDEGSESKEMLKNTLERITRAVKINTSNEYGVEFLGISKFDDRLGSCLRELQKKYFGISEEGAERFHFFRLGNNPKDKERYQRMLESYWKAKVEEEKNNSGCKIIIADVDDFLKIPEFKALYRTDRVNYYVIITKKKFYSDDYEDATRCVFETVDGKHTLKAQ